MDIVETRNLKLELLTSGVSIDRAAWVQISNENKLPTTARTGLANGLEIILPNEVWVNALVAPNCSLQVAYEGDAFFLVRENDQLCKIKLPPKPEWYGKRGDRGELLSSIGQVRGDRLSITLFKDCTYFYSGEQCGFCAINYNPNKELLLKDPAQICELVVTAEKDRKASINHIYFNLGNTEFKERGLPIYEKLMLELCTVTKLPIHLNQTAPASVHYLQYLKRLGFDEVSFNLEVYDDALAKQAIPGKHREIGLAHHLAMLEASVSIFGRGNVSSCLVIGLEPAASALRGIDALMTRGVIPKLSVFRPLRGSRLRNKKPPTIEFLSDLWNAAENLSCKHGVPLGPTCIPCRMLSLA